MSNTQASTNIYKCLFTYILMLLPIYMASIEIKGTFEWTKESNINVAKIILVPTKMDGVTLVDDPNNTGSKIPIDKIVADWFNTEKPYLHTTVKNKENSENGSSTPVKSDAAGLKPVPEKIPLAGIFGDYTIEVKDPNQQYQWAVQLDGKMYPLEEIREVATRGGGKKPIRQPMHRKFKTDMVFNIKITHHGSEQNTPYAIPKPSRYANVTLQQVRELANSQDKNEIIVEITIPPTPKPAPINEADRLVPNSITALASTRPKAEDDAPKAAQKPELQGSVSGPLVNKHLRNVQVSEGIKNRWPAANSSATSAAVGEAKPPVSRSKITAAAAKFNGGSAATSAASGEQPETEKVIIAYGVFTPGVTDGTLKPKPKHEVKTTGLQGTVKA